MYVRPQGDRGVKIPENYSGHAFRDQSPYGDMPPPAHIPGPPTLRRERVVVPPQVTPQAIPQPIYDTVEETAEEEGYASDENESQKSENDYEQTPPSSEPRSSSIFASLLPTATSNASHFPFGHGIGSEELLILAIMLLVFLSEESDQELLLLLGFLLFAG